MSTRFSRQVRMPEVGLNGQAAIENAKIIIVGMGGLGCPSSQYLVAAGVGEIGIVDGDRIDESNLHRQILYTPQDIGKPKVEVAKQYLQAMNSRTKIKTYFESLNSKNIASIMEKYDLILDCTDNFEIKFLLNDVCLRMKKVLITASATGFEANLMVIDGSGPCLRCLFPKAASANIGNCNLTGILGAFVGVVGAWQAAEALKTVLIRSQNNMSLSVPNNGVLFFDFYTSKVRSVVLAKNQQCLCSESCESSILQNESLYLTIDELYQLEDSVLVDVRSQDEVEIDPLPKFADIESIHKPFADIVAEQINEEFWSPEKKYVFFCTLGKRSSIVAQKLRDHGLSNAYSLRH